MNSPSSSATTRQPIRRCRLSESDLYWSAMKIRRSPELMQLLSVKSMIRYGPPKYTAGFARSLVSGESRSPAPPASTMTRASSSTCRSSALEHDAGGSAVPADDPERQAVHLVHAGFRFREIEPLDDDDPVR